MIYLIQQLTIAITGKLRAPCLTERSETTERMMSWEAMINCLFLSAQQTTTYAITVDYGREVSLALLGILQEQALCEFEEGRIIAWGAWMLGAGVVCLLVELIDKGERVLANEVLDFL